MKKLIILFTLFLIPLFRCYALDELSNYEIRYKFYKENILSKYYPKGETLEGYTEDASNIEYSEYTSWQEECPNQDNYDIDYKYEYIYQEPKKIGSVSLTNFMNINSDIGIKIYHNGKRVDTGIISDYGDFYLKLDDYYNYDELLIYAYFRNYNKYDMKLYSDNDFQEVVMESNVFPNYNYIYYIKDTFITNDNSFITNTYNTPLEETNFRTKLSERKLCRYRTINTYRTKVERIYYDDNYYTNIDGYIRDINDFKIYYKKDKEYIEVYKVDKEYIEVPTVEVIEKEVPIVSPSKETVTKEYIVREKQIPVENKSNNFKLYILLFTSCLISILLITILGKKCRLK